MHEQPDIEKICSRCGIRLNSRARFCNKCGLPQNSSNIYSLQTSKKWLGGLLGFYGLLILVCLVGNFSKNNNVDFLLLIDALFITITITGVVLTWKDIRVLMRWRNFKIMKVLVYSILAVVSATIVNFVVNWLNKSMFGIETYYYLAFEHLKYAKLITILVIAVQPALFEELAFRGVIQEGLYRIIEPRQVIYVTAFLFAILHMNFISIFWLIPFAILLSYLRNKENTLWYGVLMHFFFNATACFLEFFKLELL